MTELRESKSPKEMKKAASWLIESSVSLLERAIEIYGVETIEGQNLAQFCYILQDYYEKKPELERAIGEVKG